MRHSKGLNASLDHGQSHVFFVQSLDVQLENIWSWLSLENPQEEFFASIVELAVDRVGISHGTRWKTPGAIQDATSLAVSRLLFLLKAGLNDLGDDTA